MPVPEYYALEQQKLVLAAKEVGLFTQHGPTIGAFREQRLRDYLRKHVAKRFAVSSGFVADHDEARLNIIDRSSRQIDCLAFDEIDFTSLIRTRDFACVLPSAVVAAIEVKSTLTLFRENGDQKDPALFPFEHNGKRYRWAGTLVEAIENIRSVSQLLFNASEPTALSYFRGVFGYAGKGVDAITDPKVWGQIIDQLKLRHINELPGCICILESGWWDFAAYDWSEGDCPFDSSITYLNYLAYSKEDRGAPLQIFTSLLNFYCRERIAKEDHRVGGLRSAIGIPDKIVSQPLTLSSVGYGP